MAWTTTKTWSGSEVLTAPDINTYVSDNTDYLYDYKAASENFNNNGTNVAQLNQRIESGIGYVAVTTGNLGSMTVTFNAAFGTAPRVVASSYTSYVNSANVKDVGTGSFELDIFRTTGTATGTFGAYWVAIGA